MLKRMMTYLAMTVLLACVVSAVDAETPKLYLKDNVLAAGVFNNSATSSDMTLIIRADVDGKTIFDEGYEIGYIISRKTIRDWTDVEYDASEWKIGTSGIGYADNDDNTTIAAGTYSVFTRYYFDVPNAKNVREITFFVDYDDAHVLYLNGVEVGRSQNIQNVSPKAMPDWNETIGAITDHESTDTPAGKPNKARWNAAVGWGHNQIAEHIVEYDFGGDAPKNLGAKPTGKGGAGGAPIFLKGNVLAAANYNDGPGSSDMTLILQLSGDGVIYLDEGHDVKYIHDPDNEDVPDEWIQTKYDDRDWEDGISGVGFSDNDDNTQTPAALISIYTRYYFDAPNANKIKELVLLADYDDGYIAWLNGFNIAMAAAPEGNPPAWNATAGGLINHGSTEMAAGKPNKARWNQGAIHKTVVGFRYGGSSAQSVDPKDKLTSTWGSLKR